MQEGGRMKNNEEKRKSAANPSNTDMVLLPGSSPKPLSDGNTPDFDCIRC